MAGSGGGSAADDASMAGFHDKNSRVVGTWKIIECVSLSGSSEATGIEGTEFVLSEAGDVTWTVTDGCDALPLFSCQMYEVYTYQNLQCYGNRTLLRFAAYNGHIIEFRLDQPVMSRDLMLLTYDGWFMLQCEKLSSPDVVPDLPYSLLPALTDGYFHDVVITSRSGRKFEVHSIILKSSMPGMDWTDLCGLEDSALETVLHYLYSCSLPPDLSPATAQKTIAATRHLGNFEDFRKKCDIFIKNSNLRNRLVCLMQEVQDCVEAMAQLFNPGDPSGTSPSHLISVLKAALRQMAIGVVKVIELSQEFEHCGRRLTQEEQHEVMRYTRSRLPPILATVVRLLANVRASLAALNHHTRQQLSQQLVPEISSVLQTLCVDVGSLRTSLELIIQSSSTSLESAHSPTHLLAKSLRNDLHLRELQKLRILQENLTSFLNSLVHKKEQFEEMGGGARIRGVARIIEHFTEELPVLTLRLEEAAAALEDMLEWSEFKFVFKGATSKVGSIIERLVEHRGVVEALVVELVERVSHPAFTASLQHLGLLAPSQHPSSGDSMSPDDVKGQEFVNMSPTNSNSPGDSEGLEDSVLPCDSNSPENSSNDSRGRNSLSNVEAGVIEDPSDKSCKLSLVRRVCEPPDSRSNPLAINIGRLLHDPQLSDMTFVVVPPADDEASPSSSQEDLNVLEGHDSHHGINKDFLRESIADSSDLKCGSITPPLLKMSSTVVRKVKKSLSLDRPSVRAVMPSQAYSLDCDALTCSDHNLVPGSVLENREHSQYYVADWKSAFRNSKGNENCDARSEENIPKSESKGSFRAGEECGIINVKSKREILESIGRVDCDKVCVDIGLSSKLRNSVCLNRENKLDNSVIRCLEKLTTEDVIDNRDIQSNELEKENSGVKAETKKDSETCSKKIEDISREDLKKEFEKRKEVESSQSVSSQVLNNSQKQNTTKDSLLGKSNDSQSYGDVKLMKSTSSEAFQKEKIGKICVARETSSSVMPQPERDGGEPKYGWEGVELKAHRVVVASRCEWFRRALLSGMREAIDRCIVVHGCSVATFQLLLGFLYTGHVECTNLPPDQLVDLLVLADHYGVDALKFLVESGLEQHVDDDSVVPLLTVAHHCNAAHLKEVCVHHCVVSDVVLESEALGQLPEDLRHHLTLALGKHRKLCSGAIGEEVLVGGEGAGGEDSPLSVSSTDPLIDDQISLIPGFQYAFGSGHSLEGGGGRLEAVVQQLREVVGQQVPRSTLVQITLAADYDLNRALNFFFASSS
ncbi:uncharacterized protein [Macrobrachium rosenbergii]|uniref:uncharacterized protein isoform X1 n=2 Tax=Macrobrachium rosenbergii TaxID=79674 RepID=UPI0034D44E1A